MKDYNVLLTCGETTMVIIHDAFDKGYQQGYEDGQKSLVNAYVVGKGEDTLEDIKEAEYNRGLNDAWEVARKIEHPKGYFCNIKEVFGEESAFSVLLNMTASEAIQKINDYEEKQKQDAEFKVGDEVYLLDENHPRVVTNILDDNGRTRAIQITENGKWVVDDIKDIHKTGRHFDEISEVLAEMRGAENADVTD